MSLLSIVQDIADEAGLTRPSAAYGSTDPAIQQVVRVVNKVGKRLVTEAPWQALRKEKTFTGVAGETQTSIIPADFDRFIPETFWDRTNNVLFSGPVTSTEWQGLKAGSYSDTSLPRFAYRGGDVLIIPGLDGGESLAFEYVSTQWCQSSGGTGQTAWAADTDTGVLDEELLTLGGLYELLAALGQPSQAAAAQYQARMKRLLGNDQARVDVLSAGDIFGGGRHFSGAPQSRNWMF